MLLVLGEALLSFDVKFEQAYGAQKGDEEQLDAVLERLAETCGISEKVSVRQVGVRVTATMADVILELRAGGYQALFYLVKEFIGL